MVTRARLVRISLLLGAATSGCQLIAGISDLPGGPSDTRAPAFDGGAPGTTPSPTPNSGPDADAPSADGPPSCASLPKTCGPAGGDDCCEAPPVPGGSFLRNYDGRDFTARNLRATLHPFRLDRFEVTVGRFRKFVAAYAGGWRPAAGQGRNASSANDMGWIADWSAQLPTGAMELVASVECRAEFQTYTRVVAGNERRPINCVTWPVAYAFCIWDEGRLPTDAEWNFAAAGGDEQRYYPWNADIDDSRSSYYVDASEQCFGDRAPGCTLADLTPVGTHAPGAAKWGHADMSGNVAEWVRDGDASKDVSCDDCIDVTGPEDTRRVRGGSFVVAAPGTLIVAKFVTLASTSASEQMGFRCARTP
jgi:sulfatase modifying factor 1